MNAKYSQLLEALDNRRFIKNVTILHGSPHQGLDVLKPWDHERQKVLNYRPIYTSTDPAYTSAFTFKHEDGIELRKGHDGWIIKIPKSLENKLKTQFCSIYTVDIKFFHPINHGRTPDWVSPFNDIPVLKEDQFASPLDAMKKHGLKIEWVD